METGRHQAVGTLGFFTTTIILAVAALVTGRALGLPRCFRSLGKLCPEASAGCACRRTAAVVGGNVTRLCQQRDLTPVLHRPVELASITDKRDYGWNVR